MSQLGFEPRTPGLHPSEMCYDGVGRRQHLELSPRFSLITIRNDYRAPMTMLRAWPA